MILNPGRLMRYAERLRMATTDGGTLAVVQQVVASLRWRLSSDQRGMRQVLRENQAFDARYGTDTHGEMSLEALGVGAAEAAHGNGVYRAIPSSHFRLALAQLDVRLEDYVFLDYGSGKGKALLLAAAYPFRRIIGIEYARELHEAALRNVARYESVVRPCNRIEACHADARAFEPPVQPLVCFFFNPFDVSTWRVVLGRLESSYARSPRAMHIVYVNVRNVDELEDFFPEFPRFTQSVATRHLRILSATPAVPARQV